MRMIRQPPAYVPNAIVAAERKTTQSGTWNLGSSPAATSASVIAAIVFCASLAPWEYETNAAVATWSTRKVRFSRTGLNLNWWITSRSTVINAAPTAKPIGGEMTRLATCLASALHLTPSRP